MLVFLLMGVTITLLLVLLHVSDSTALFVASLVIAAAALLIGLRFALSFADADESSTVGVSRVKEAAGGATATAATTTAATTAAASNASNASNESVEARLREAQAQLVQSEKMASLGQLTAGIAHEINNPINFVAANVKPLQRDIASLIEVLRHYSELDGRNGVVEELERIRVLREELELDYVVGEIDQLIRGIEDGARRTAEIVRGLRTFSRADETELRRCDIHDGLDSTLVLLHSTYKERIEIVREYGTLPEIECYPGQLNQVFMNLLTNAIQAIEASGRITIRTDAAGESVRVMIADTGAGIPEELRTKIFDPFFTTKDVGKGTGLGLSITLDIIRRHNGTIDVESAPGAGTTFTLTLPVSQGEQRTDRAQP